MKFGTVINGIVARFAKDGSGEIDRGQLPAASCQMLPFHAYNTIPGETVTGRFVKRTKDGPKLEIDTINVASPSRVAPRCPYAGRCGGCKWQHVDYPAQLAAKLDTFRRIAVEKDVVLPPLSSRAKASEVEGSRDDKIIPCSDPFYYRNRMDFVFSERGDLGLKTPDRWWDVRDLSTCFLLSPESVEAVKRVREWARISGLPFWNAHTYRGFFRYLVIREGKRTGERMVMLVTAPTSFRCLPERSEGPHEDPSAAPQESTVRQKLTELPALLGDLATSVVWGINPTVTDLSVAEEIIPLKGDPWIHENVNGIRYKITPNAFFQTNTEMTEQLQNKVREFCGDLSGKTLLDLFCGSGFFSLALGKHEMAASVLKKSCRGSAAQTCISKERMPSRIIGIELSAEAIACAKENTVANGVAAEYFVSKAEEFDWNVYAPDVVILDPPRAGLHPKVIETILAAKPPRIVYVSCSYPRFFDEYKKLAGTYRLANAAALDLFPHTPHMECVFLLERN